MKHLILSIFLLSFLAAQAQDQNCPHYHRLMQDARDSWALGNYGLALNQLAAAREHCPDNGSKIDSQFLAFTREIDARYREAKTAREEARVQATEAEKARARADREAAAARRARDMADSTALVARQIALRAYANDLASKSEIALRNGDRTSAFRLAEFAHRYVDADNDNVTRALVNALYYNDKPGRQHLPWCFNLEGHTGYVSSIAFSPDGRQLATSSEDFTAKVWNLETGKAILTLKGHTNSIRSIAFSPDGRQLATGSEDFTAKLWNLKSGEAILTLKDHGNTISSVAFSPDGCQLATGSEDGTAKVWNLETGKAILTLYANGHITSVAFSPDGCQMATGSDDFRASVLNLGSGMAKVWSLESGEAILTLKAVALVSSVAFSPDGQQLATGFCDNTAKVWNLESGEAILSLKGHTDCISSVAFSPDGQYLATGSYDNTAKVWNLESGEATFTLEGHTGYVRSIAFSPACPEGVDCPFGNGQQLATGSDDHTVKVWNLKTGEATFTLKGHTGDFNSINSVAFSPACPEGMTCPFGDGQYLATGSEDSTAKVWNLESGEAILTLEGHTDDINCVAFSPNSQLLATGSDDHTVKVWNLESGEVTLTLGEHTDYINCVAFSPDGKYLATGSDDNTAKVWNLESGEAILTLYGQEVYISNGAFSPDGQYLATGPDDNTAKVWNLKTGEATLTLEGHTDYINCVAFSPDGKYLATGSDDNTAKVWNLKTGEATLTLEGHTDYINCVAFSPDGQQLATGSDDLTVKIWNLDNGKATLSLEGHTHWVTSVAFSPDGKQLATGSVDNTVKIWQLDPSAIIFWLHRQQRLSTLIQPQLRQWDMEDLIGLQDANEERLRQTNESRQIAAFARLAAQLAQNSQDLARTAPSYACAARLYQYAINSGGDSLLVRELGELYKRHTVDILDSERPDTALYYARLAAQLLPGDAEAHLALVASRFLAGQSLKDDTEPSILLGAADLLFEEENWEEAGRLYERVEGLGSNPESLFGLYRVSEKLSWPFDFQRFLASNEPNELRKYGDYFYKQESWEQAYQLYEKAEGLGHRTETLLRWQECAKNAGQPFDFQRFLSSEWPEELRRYADYFFEREDWEQAYQLYEKAEGLKHDPASLIGLHQVAGELGQIFNFQRFLESEYALELLEYIRYFYRAEELEKTLQLAERRMEVHDVAYTRAGVLFFARELGEDRFAELFLVEEPNSLRDYATYFIEQAEWRSPSEKLSFLRSSMRIGEHLLQIQDNPENRQLVADYCDILASNLLLAGEAEEAETVLKQGLKLAPEHPYLTARLPHVLLLRGDTVGARAEYLKWADEPFGFQGLATYRDAFLDDFYAFEIARLEIEGLEDIKRVLEKGD